MVQSIDGQSGCLLDRFADEFPGPKHIVEQDETVLPDAGQDQFVIRLVLRLVGIDEDKVEGQSGLELALALDCVA